jgi:hypothetical protein
MKQDGRDDYFKDVQSVESGSGAYKPADDGFASGNQRRFIQKGMQG